MIVQSAIDRLWHVAGKVGLRGRRFVERRLDLFGGSGSTLIAAEQTGRKAFLMEIDGLYADVIVARYQRLTGQPGVLQRTGASPIPMKPREEKML